MLSLVVVRQCPAGQVVVFGKTVVSTEQSVHPDGGFKASCHFQRRNVVCALVEDNSVNCRFAGDLVKKPFFSSFDKIGSSGHRITSLFVPGVD